MNAKRLISVSLILMIALLLFGCSASSGASEPVDFSTLKTIGTQDGEYVSQIAVENRSGFSISALSVKRSQTKEFTGNTLNKEDPFIYGETRLLCFASADPAAHPESYEMCLVLGRDLFRTIHSIPFSLTDRCTLYSDGEFCYLEYVNQSGERVSTRSLEKEFYHEEKARIDSAEGCIGSDGLVY